MLDEKHQIVKSEKGLGFAIAAHLEQTFHSSEVTRPFAGEFIPPFRFILKKEWKRKDQYSLMDLSEHPWPKKIGKLPLIYSAGPVHHGFYNYHWLMTYVQ